MGFIDRLQSFGTGFLRPTPPPPPPPPPEPPAPEALPTDDYQTQGTGNLFYAYQPTEEPATQAEGKSTSAIISDLTDLADLTKGAKALEGMQGLDKITKVGNQVGLAAVGWSAVEMMRSSAGFMKDVSDGASLAEAAAEHGEDIMDNAAAVIDKTENVAALAEGIAKEGSALGKVGATLGKAAGPAAIVAGGYFGIKSGIQAYEELAKDPDERDNAQLAGGVLGTVSGALSIAGGVAMATGAGAPVGAVLLAASGVASVAQLAVENWDDIEAGAGKVADSVENAVEDAAEALEQQASDALETVENTFTELTEQVQLAKGLFNRFFG